jgi:hypothetical protein
LSDEFRARLGWLLGNLYSRPDSSDWSDHEGGDDGLKRLLKQYLSTLDTEMGPFWLEDAKVKEAKNLGVPMPTGTPEENFKALAALRPKTPKEIGLDTIIAELRQSASSFEPKHLDRIRTNLSNNPTLTQQFRSR